MAPALMAVAHGAEYVEIHVMDDIIELNQPDPIDAAVSWDFEELTTFIKIAREMEVIR